jgi:predicted outer membrane repeat protein
MRRITLCVATYGAQPVGFGLFETDTDNIANDGPAGGIYNSGTMIIADSDVSDNYSHRGGAILNSGTAEIRDSTIARNSAGSKNGGGIYNTGTMTITSTALTDNFAFNGGGIHNGGTVTITDSAITGSDAYHGAGIYNAASGTVRLEGTTSVTYNSAASLGGGIYNLGGTVTIAPPVSIANNTPDDCSGC